MKYDDPNYHWDSEFSEDVSENNAMTHMGFFIAWLMVFGFNLILPLMMAIPITSQSGRIGMTVAISLFLLNATNHDDRD